MYLLCTSLWLKASARQHGDGDRHSHLHQTAEVSEVVDEVEQLADVVGYRRAAGVHPLQMLLVHLTHPWKHNTPVNPLTAVTANIHL